MSDGEAAQIPKWQDVDYELLPGDDARIAAIVRSACRTYINGGCLAFGFRARNAAAFDAAERCDRKGLDHLLASFLRNPIVQRELAQTRIADATVCPPPYGALGPLQLEGALADSLARGGAYTGGVPVDAARELARDFVAAVIGNPSGSAYIFKLEGAWTPWFYDVAWDSSYAICTITTRTWWLLFMTDTD